jgi:hypothetical protein
MNYVVFWEMSQCRSCVNRRFGGKCRFHLQGGKIRERGTSVSRWLATSFLWIADTFRIGVTGNRSVSRHLPAEVSTNIREIADIRLYPERYSIPWPQCSRFRRHYEPWTVQQLRSLKMWTVMTIKLNYGPAFTAWRRKMTLLSMERASWLVAVSRFCYCLKRLLLYMQWWCNLQISQHRQFVLNYAEAVPCTCGMLQSRYV